MELVKRIKKYYVDHYLWIDFAKIQKASENETTDIEVLRHLNLLWTSVVRRLNQRIYENEEGKTSPFELLEILFRKDQKIAKDPSMQAMYVRLLKEEKEKSEEEKKKKQENERIFRNRVEEHTTFRAGTYAHLKDACGRICHIDYAIADASFADANITETLYLPEPPDRNRALSYMVDLTPEQLEGYLFLASLGEMGGNPLTRSVLTAHTY